MRPAPTCTTRPGAAPRSSSRPPVSPPTSRGAVAAETVRPVIGVPIDAGPLNGLDALLSTVQMPAGIPVATVAIGRAGARNAAWLAAQILALQEPRVGERLLEERAAARDAVAANNAGLADRLANR